MHCEHRPQQTTTLERPDEHTASIHCVRFREHILKYHFDYEEGYPHSSFITNRSLFPFLCFFFSTSIIDKLHRIVVLGDTGVGKTSIVKVSIYILIIMFIMVMVMVVGIVIINITKLSGWSCKRLTRFTSATDHISKDPPPSAALVLPPLQIMLMLYVVMTMMMFTIILLFDFHS